jgi:hypothetical protein
MGTALNECRKFLEGGYRSSLSLQTGFADQMAETQPAWLPVSLGDLSHRTKEDGRAVALVDPEIGTILYLLEYHTGQDVVALMVKALSIRTRLLLGTEAVAEGAEDRRGSWRIALYWLIEKQADVEKWETAVAKLRAQAPHMEEIPIDSICKNGGSWKDAFQAHGFPRLLLQARKVLRIKTRHDVAKWSTADAQVEEELRAFSSRFSRRALFPPFRRSAR